MNGDHISRPSSITRVTSSSSRDSSVSCLEAPSNNNDLALFLRYFDRKEDRLREERHLEKERIEKRLEEHHQQQTKAIQDNFIYKQEQLDKQKAKEEKPNRDAEVQRIEDKHWRDREHASKDIQAIPTMRASENIYNCIVTIETIFTAINIPKDMWAGALGQVFTGNAFSKGLTEQVRISCPKF